MELDYSKISAEEIVDPTKYSIDDFAAWRQLHPDETYYGVQENNDLFLQGFNSDKMKGWQ